MSRSLLKTLATPVIVAVAVAVWLVQPSAQKRTSTTVEPFQIGLPVVVPGNQQSAVGTATFNVPAGKRLNLKFMTSNQGFTTLIEIDTVVGGQTVTHYRLTSAQYAWDRPLDLWADDTGPVIIRVPMNTLDSPPITWNISLSGELY